MPQPQEFFEILQRQETTTSWNSNMLKMIEHSWTYSCFFSFVELAEFLVFVEFLDVLRTRRVRGPGVPQILRLTRIRRSIREIPCVLEFFKFRDFPKYLEC